MRLMHFVHIDFLILLFLIRGWFYTHQKDFYTRLRERERKKEKGASFSFFILWFRKKHFDLSSRFLI